MSLKKLCISNEGIINRYCSTKGEVYLTRSRLRIFKTAEILNLKCDVGVLLLDLEEQGFKLVVYAGNAFDVLMRKSQCFKIDDMQFFLDRS